MREYVTADNIFVYDVGESYGHLLVLFFQRPQRCATERTARQRTVVAVKRSVSVTMAISLPAPALVNGLVSHRVSFR